MSRCQDSSRRICSRSIWLYDYACAARAHTRDPLWPKVCCVLLCVFQGYLLFCTALACNVLLRSSLWPPSIRSELRFAVLTRVTFELEFFNDHSHTCWCGASMCTRVRMCHRRYREGVALINTLVLAKMEFVTVPQSFHNPQRSKRRIQYECWTLVLHLQIPFTRVASDRIATSLSRRPRRKYIDIVWWWIHVCRGNLGVVFLACHIQENVYCWCCFCISRTSPKLVCTSFVAKYWLFLYMSLSSKQYYSSALRALSFLMNS